MNARRLVKYPLRLLRDRTSSFVADRRTRRHFFSRVDERFDFASVRDAVLNFVQSMRCPGEVFSGYRYSHQANHPTLYSSVYACMTMSLFGKLRDLSDRQVWTDYFDSFQSPTTGLFYDRVIQSDRFEAFDWWGARHLALHMVAGYSALGSRPKHRLIFLEKYYEPQYIRQWLGQAAWDEPFSYADDIDNKIMNIGCLLQYQRDTWNDEAAGDAVRYLLEYLAERVNPETGMWGRFDTHRPTDRSRMVQFAYHLFPLYFYDGVLPKYPDRIVRHVLDTQNPFGGFGVKVNSSACEDIDSIDLLVRLAEHVPTLKHETDEALSRALRWVMCNQVEDGGFVFRLYEPFVYGDRELASLSNQGAMLPTWFRTLSLAYLTKYLGLENGFVITRTPGYEF